MQVGWPKVGKFLKSFSLYQILNFENGMVHVIIKWYLLLCSCCAVTQSCPILWPHVQHQASLSITNSQSLLKFMSIELMTPSNHLILCHSLLLLPSIVYSIRIFSSESVLRIRLPKYWCFTFGISPSNEYSGIISFRMDWLDLFAV